MSVPFEKSYTKINLLKSFAGESQARNRYTFSATQARKDGLQIIEKAFIFTADQEKEHAKLFYNKLKQFAGNTIQIQGDFPIDLYDNTLDLLKCAQHNEYEEYQQVYKSFGDEAKSEGFEDIATLFYGVAEIEKNHGDRFSRFAELLESKELFKSENEISWICLNCGHAHFGLEAPKECPVCSHPQGYFTRTPVMI